MEFPPLFLAVFCDADFGFVNWLTLCTIQVLTNTAPAPSAVFNSWTVLE